MIVFIDDEKWSISGYFDYFDNEKIKNNKFEYKHFFYATDAWDYIKANYNSIDIIILDLMLYYGFPTKGQKGKSGGIKFLEEIRSQKKYDEIPILLYTVISKNNIANYNNFENINYLSRDCKDELFYKKIKELIL